MRAAQGGTSHANDCRKAWRRPLNVVCFRTELELSYSALHSYTIASK